MAESRKAFDYYLDVARTFSNQAEAYANQKATSRGKTGGSATPIRRISAAKFPPAILVQYTDVPIGMYQSFATERLVEQVVLYSFGQEWHADTRGGGWLNSTAPQQGVVPWGTESDRKYVARGSDTSNFYHEVRYLTSLTRYAGNAATLPVHFLINRRGDLLVVNDCNVAFSDNGDLNTTCVSIALEEALYAPTDTRAPSKKVTWSTSGGTALPLDYSEEQLTTLAILMKKLELAYPALQSRNVYTLPGEMITTGYACGDAVSRSRLNGVVTHFGTTRVWDALFQRVDTYGAITELDVFDTYGQFSIGMDVPTLSDSSEVVGGDNNRKYMEQVQIDMLARRRAYALLNMNKAANSLNAADGAQRQALRYSNKAMLAQKQAAAINVPVSGLPATDQPEGVAVAAV